MNFLQSDWFSWVVLIFVLFGILYNFGKSAEESGVDLWGVAKAILSFFLFLVFMPFVFIFGRTKSRKK